MNEELPQFKTKTNMIYPLVLSTRINVKSPVDDCPKSLWTRFAPANSCPGDIHANAADTFVANRSRQITPDHDQPTGDFNRSSSQTLLQTVDLVIVRKLRKGRKILGDSRKRLQNRDLTAFSNSHAAPRKKTTFSQAVAHHHYM
ncbi:hypothetical protein [Propionivibrio limicola]|uniref:hypothetical protein n=1 Tax=Propionivibrio limicola TaxID=167645 RepID=UPI001290EE2C|nr:hypothetical protein [Propionivibrio limicola]